MNTGTFVRSVVCAAFMAIIAVVSVADFPYEYDLWYSVCMDPNGYWHELFYIFVGWHAVMWWTLYWEKKLTGWCPLCGGTL